MHCISLAILSRLSRFPSPAVVTNWPFYVDVPLKHQSINQSINQSIRGIKCAVCNSSWHRQVIAVWPTKRPVSLSHWYLHLPGMDFRGSVWGGKSSITLSPHSFTNSHSHPITTSPFLLSFPPSPPLPPTNVYAYLLTLSLLTQDYFSNYTLP